MKNLFPLLLLLVCFAASPAQDRYYYVDPSSLRPPMQSTPSRLRSPSTTATNTPARGIASVILTVHNGYPDRESRLTSNPSPMMTMTIGKHLKGHTTGNALIDSYIVDSSRRYNIDPLLIYAQMAQESAFRVRALSHKGASGLMQLMPPTARRMGVTDIYDPKQNIEGGIKYMRLLLNMFGGDLNLALAGYNAGEGAVIKYGYKIPPYNETQNYVRIISARYKGMTYGARGYIRKD